MIRSALSFVLFFFFFGLEYFLKESHKNPFKTAANETMKMIECLKKALGII